MVGIPETLFPVTTTSPLSPSQPLGTTFSSVSPNLFEIPQVSELLLRLPACVWLTLLGLMSSGFTHVVSKGGFP